MNKILSLNKRLLSVLIWNQILKDIGCWWWGSIHE